MSRHLGPATVIFGIILGSAAAIVLGLLVVLLNFWLLGDRYPWIKAELSTLLTAAARFSVLTTVAACSFYGSLRQRPWRGIATLATLGALTGIGLYYWPSSA